MRLVLPVLGVVLIGVAWSVRQNVLAARAQAKRAAAAAAQAAAEADRRAAAAKMEAEASTLEARVAANPADVRLHQNLLLLYQQTGHPDKGTEQLAEIVRLNPGDRTAALALANARLALKQWPQAESVYRNCIARWPKSPDGWQGLAAALFHETRYREAAVSARTAVKLNPKNLSNHYILAASLQEDVLQYPEPQLHMDELELAQSELAKLIPALPKVGDLYLRLGRVRMALKDADGAAKNLERAQQLLPGRADVALLLARAYTSGRNSPAARKVLEAALARHPDSAELNDALGQIIQASGEPDADPRSLALFQKAVQLDPGASRFAERLGTAYLRVNDLQHAREAFETAARLSPNRAFPFHQLAAIYTRQGDPKRATAAAREAQILDFNAQQFNTLQAVAKRHPENVLLRLALADRYRFLGMTRPARDEYRAILSLDANNSRARAGLAALERPRPATGIASAQTSTSRESQSKKQ
jgi:tetratricopeptide (TPR) repeat protein